MGYSTNLTIFGSKRGIIEPYIEYLQRIFAIGDEGVISEYLQQLRAQRNITVHQLAEQSGVPESSVHRILSGYTDNPNFQTVCDLVTALNGSLDEMAGIKSPTHEPADRSAEFDLLRTMIAEKNQIISEKNRWIARAVCVSCFLIVFILAVALIDVLNGGFGYWRY